jgi:hypothetical protein
MTTETLQKSLGKIHYYGAKLHETLATAIDAEARFLNRENSHPAGGNTNEADITFLERAGALLSGTEDERDDFIFRAAKQLAEETDKPNEYWEERLYRTLTVLREKGRSVLEEALRTSQARYEP